MFNRRRARPADATQLSLFDAAAPEASPGMRDPDGAAPEHDEFANAPAPAPPETTLTYRHPRGEREVRIGSHVVGYALRRTRRRSVGFMVDGEGLTVSAPRWVPQRDIDAAVLEKSGWILRQLHTQRERSRRLQSTRIDWRNGARFPFLGQEVEVVLDQATTGTVLQVRGEASAGAPGLTLQLGLPTAATPEQIRDAVHSWLQRQARRVFEERARAYATRLGVTLRRLALSSAQTRWGSASADGSIRLNWRLIHFAMPTIDYVVAHELAHLRHMDHSPRFWDVVRSVVPDLEAARSTLRHHELPPME
jgi:hypothetical protein